MNSVEQSQNKSTGKKVFVGLSGGVDSSVAALLLRDAGYDVIGVFIKTWQPDYIECTWREDRLDAMRIAAQLGIHFITLDLESEYKKSVIDYMLGEYKNNRTPNPDIMCNRDIKFGAFYDYAISAGADYIATGHYAQVKTIDNSSELFTAVDDNKDQSYFLYNIKKEHLDHVLFPLANLTKDKVREIAQKNNLYTKNKKDSQGICMLGNISIKDFLKQELSPTGGDIKNIDGEVIGKHDGVILYTLGERHGFEIIKHDVSDAPYYIIEKDFENNVLVVSHEYPSVNKTETTLESFNVLTSDMSDFQNDIYARARYRAPLVPVNFDLETYTVKTVSGDILYTPGQSVVLYNSAGKVLGGGVVS
jgi:tRNA-specific 2-thiouridylase